MELAGLVSRRPPSGIGLLQALSRKFPATNFLGSKRSQPAVSLSPPARRSARVRERCQPSERLGGRRQTALCSLASCSPRLATSCQLEWSARAATSPNRNAANFINVQQPIWPKVERVRARNILLDRAAPMHTVSRQVTAPTQSPGRKRDFCNIITSGTAHSATIIIIVVTVAVAFVIVVII